MGLKAYAREVCLDVYKEVVDLHVDCELVEHVDLSAVLGELLSREMEEVTA